MHDHTPTPPELAAGARAKRTLRGYDSAFSRWVAHEYSSGLRRLGGPWWLHSAPCRPGEEDRPGVDRGPAGEDTALVDWRGISDARAMAASGRFRSAVAP